MRFVSQYAGFTVGIQAAKRVRTMSDEIIESSPFYQAVFDNRAWNQHDLEVAIRHLRFEGMPQYEDQATPVSPAIRISVYDTEEAILKPDWPEGLEKETVERKLLNAMSYGRAFVIVPEVALEAPWPNYDLHDGNADSLVLLVHSLGISFETVLEYESSKWGQQRAEVIEALQTGIMIRDENKVIVS